MLEHCVISQLDLDQELQSDEEKPDFITSPHFSEGSVIRVKSEDKRMRFVVY